MAVLHAEGCARERHHMSRIRAKHTKPELAVRKALRERGLTGYRLPPRQSLRPADIAFVGRKVAVFVHGCFWHGCPHFQPRRPKTHKTFWNAKLDRNMERDAEKAKALKRVAGRCRPVGVPGEEGWGRGGEGGSFTSLSHISESMRLPYAGVANESDAQVWTISIGVHPCPSVVHITPYHACVPPSAE